MGFFALIGTGWAAATLDDDNEKGFIEQILLSSYDQRAYFISGSTSVTPGRIITESVSSFLNCMNLFLKLVIMSLVFTIFPHLKYKFMIIKGLDIFASKVSLEIKMIYLFE